jgi:ABC-type antimicrobial peptide transport system permease subunit
VGPVLELVERRQLESAALADPLRVALDAILVVGFLAALATTIVGFGLHFLVAARVRLGEYAVLRANGLSASVVRRSLAIEQAVLLGYGLVTGTALGALIAVAVLPAVQLGGAPADYIPPTMVTIDPVGLLVAAAFVVFGALLIGWLAGRASGRFRLLDELRQLG